MEEQPHDQIMGVEGLVKWFDQRKGYGFIIGPRGQDIFVHFSVIDGEGYRVLEDGDAVLYDAVLSDKGWKATRLRRLTTTPIVIPPKRGHTRSPRR